MDDDPKNKKLVLEYRSPSTPQIPAYRRILAGILVLAGIVMAVMSAFYVNESARINMCTVGSA